MTANNKDARVAGFLYLLLVVVAPFRLIYIPSRLFVPGNASATAANIVTHETLFRLGMVADLFCAVIGILLVLALYRAFKGVDKVCAVLMVALGAVAQPAIYFFNVLNDAVTLLLVRGAHFLSVFDKAQLDALAFVFIRLHGLTVTAAEVFWGLWLFPLAILVLRSRRLPRVLGYWLIVNGFAYLALSVSGLVTPQYDGVVANLALPAQLGEVAFMFWLLVAGVRKPEVSA